MGTACWTLTRAPRVTWPGPTWRRPPGADRRRPPGRAASTRIPGPPPARGARGYAERQEGARRRGPGRGGCCSGGRPADGALSRGCAGSGGTGPGLVYGRGESCLHPRPDALVSPLQTFLRVRANRQTRLNGECGPHRACPSGEVSRVGPSCVAPPCPPHRRPGAATSPAGVSICREGAGGVRLKPSTLSPAPPAGAKQAPKPCFLCGAQLLLQLTWLNLAVNF